MDTQIKMENDEKINKVKEGMKTITTPNKMIEDRVKGLKMIAKEEMGTSATPVPVRYCFYCAFKMTHLSCNKFGMKFSSLTCSK